MSEGEDDFAPFAEHIPEGAVPMFGFLIVAYLDGEDGVIYDDYKTVGNMTLRDALGTLESVKFRITADQYDLLRGDDE